MIIIAIYLCIFSRTYNLITVQLELPLEEIYHLLFVSGSALVSRVTLVTGVGFLHLIARYKMSKKRSTRRQTAQDIDETYLSSTATVYDGAKFVSNPNRFYGRIGEDFEQWIKEFERCARASHWLTV